MSMILEVDDDQKKKNDGEYLRIRRSAAIVVELHSDDCGNHRP